MTTPIPYRVLNGKMASSSGKRALGTDGSDFSHRERVASRYQRSPQLKKVLQRLIVIQVFCWAFTVTVSLVTWDVPSLLAVVGYCISIPAGWTSLQRNNITLINIYGVSSSLLGIFPMGFTLYSYLWSGGIASHHVLRLIEAFLIIGVNLTASYFAKELMQLWGGLPSSSKSKTKRK